MEMIRKPLEMSLKENREALADSKYREERIAKERETFSVPEGNRHERRKAEAIARAEAKLTALQRSG